MTKTLYRLADGTQANPADCEPDADGVLRHALGMPVALDSEGKPETVVLVPRKPAAELVAETEETKEAEPEPAKSYKNRELKGK